MHAHVAAFPYLDVTKISIRQPCLSFAVYSSHMLPRRLRRLDVLLMCTAQSRECVADSQNQESYEFRSKHCIRSQSLDYDTAQSVWTFSSSLHTSTVTGQTALRKGARRFRQHHRDRLCALTLIFRNSPKLYLPSSWPPEGHSRRNF